MTKAIWRSMRDMEEKRQKVYDRIEQAKAYVNVTTEAYERAREQYEEVKAVAQRNLDKIEAKDRELNILFGSKKGRPAKEINRMMALVELEIEEFDDPNNDLLDAPFEPNPRPAVKRKRSRRRSEKQPCAKKAVTASSSRPSRKKNMFDPEDAWKKDNGPDSMVSVTDSEYESDYYVSKRRQRSLSEHSNIILAPASTTRLASQTADGHTLSPMKPHSPKVSPNAIDSSHLRSAASIRSYGTSLLAPERGWDSFDTDGEPTSTQTAIEMEGNQAPGRHNGDADNLGPSGEEDEAVPTIEWWDQQQEQHEIDVADSATTAQVIAGVTSASYEPHLPTVPPNVIELTRVQPVASSSTDLDAPESMWHSSDTHQERKMTQAAVELESYYQPSKSDDDVDYLGLFGEGDEAVPTTEWWDQQQEHQEQQEIDIADSSRSHSYRSRSSSGGLFVVE